MFLQLLLVSVGAAHEDSNTSVNGSREVYAETKNNLTAKKSMSHISQIHILLCDRSHDCIDDDRIFREEAGVLGEQETRKKNDCGESKSETKKKK